ncbi:aminotransferase class I/II-fold pyridoxal phosphate-dependent enzyme [Candidatus Soleaferrea massiliensis]|uniref:aminotransferase class I/II-fold pyridoxal phosphate-dependent enzyme n=1 Tax=Candidatus Soleaferrea massiliensis TaxID=1470354 RepID=UPI000693E33E|nr:aminotransferase class I/II-fold pyridoxal phosphate-dependent enzyme [Candidatus Soleaferrea massiliensis]
MASLLEMSKQDLESLQEESRKAYQAYQAEGLKLDMSRGKPSTEQLDLAVHMLDCVSSSTDVKTQNNIDCRNYGLLDGIPEARQLFADILHIPADQIIIGGNSSLNMMYDTVARAMTHGVYGSEKPWCKYDKIKFLCPAPGYDRHFAICEFFGIEMVNIDMREDGPDMDMIERLVLEDETIKGIWCVPKYSNPQGITYSDEVVRRFANLKPKASDFRIFWDDAYCVHDLYEDRKDHLLNLLTESQKAGNGDIVFLFASTSKISFSGSGISMIAASKNNIEFLRRQIAVQTIGPDKINQLRHVRFYQNADGIHAHMKKHAAIIRPKFHAVLQGLSKHLDGLGVASWTNPNGGYFISLDVLEGCAKRVVQLCKEAGVVMTPAGATYPYGNDPKDQNIRIAPTYPSSAELAKAVEILCIAIKIASVEKILASRACGIVCEAAANAAVSR